MDTTREIILALRKRGLTQTAISRRTGVPQPRISRWMTNGAPPGVDDVLRLQRLLREVGDSTEEVPPVANDTQGRGPQQQETRDAA